MASVLCTQIASTWSSLIKASSKDNDVTFRQHTLFVCSALLVTGIAATSLQIAEIAVQVNCLPSPSAESLHFYNGLWDGGAMCMLSLFGMACTLFYPSLNGVMGALTEPVTLHPIEKIFRKNIRNYGILHVLFISCIGLFLLGIATVTVSAKIYPNFTTYFNTTFTQNSEFRKIRLSCLTLQGLLLWCAVFGLFLTVLTGAFTLNRIAHYAPAVELAINSGATRKISTSSTLSKKPARKKSIIERFGTVLERGERNRSFTLDEDRTSGRSSQYDTEPITNTGSKLLLDSSDRTEERNNALISLAEFLRNRRISRFQAPAIPQPDLNQTTSV